LKIIHVVGTSGSGKTTFIRSLLAELQKHGSIAAVKHLGHHSFALAPEKDTTVLFETGITCAVGIDDEKAVYISRRNRLSEVLRDLAGSGIDYTVIEGFKREPFPKIVFGDLSADNIVLRDPSVDAVMRSLSRFPDFIPGEEK
jgi:molybdopterin-guanine dinucleotide biosynthesis protein MobB